MRVVKYFFEYVKRLSSSLANYLSAKGENAWQSIVLFLSTIKNNTKSTFKRFGQWLLNKIKTAINAINLPVFYSATVTVLVVLSYAILTSQKTQSPFTQNLLKNNSQIMQSFIDWMGIPYGLLISMILVRAWDHLESAGIALEKEAYDILNFIQEIKLISLPSTPDLEYKNTIESLLRAYIEHVESKYDTEYIDSSQERTTGDQILIEIRRVIKATPILQEFNLEQKLNDLEQSRRERLLKSKIRMPLSLQILLFLSSLLWLTPFLSISFNDLWLSYIFIGGLTFVVFTIISTSLSFYEPTSIRRNDISGSWKELKSRI